MPSSSHEQPKKTLHTTEGAQPKSGGDFKTGNADGAPQLPRDHPSRVFTNPQIFAEVKQGSDGSYEIVIPQNSGHLTRDEELVMSRWERGGHVRKHEYSDPRRSRRMRCPVKSCGHKTLNIPKIRETIAGHFKEYHSDPVYYHVKYATRWSWGYIDIPPFEPTAQKRHKTKIANTVAQNKRDAPGKGDHSGKTQTSGKALGQQGGGSGGQQGKSRGGADSGRGEATGKGEMGGKTGDRQGAPGNQPSGGGKGRRRQQNKRIPYDGMRKEQQKDSHGWRHSLIDADIKQGRKQG